MEIIIISKDVYIYGNYLYFWHIYLLQLYIGKIYSIFLGKNQVQYCSYDIYIISYKRFMVVRMRSTCAKIVCYFFSF